MTQVLRLAVVGAGLIGRAHVKAISLVGGACLGCIVDPSDEAQEYAKAIGADWFRSLDDMFERTSVDGAILATPNRVHLEGALTCIANKCPVLVEKPLATCVAEAEQIVTAANAAGVAVLTGHHRRHSMMMKKAKSVIDGKTLGRIVSFQGTCWFHKPDDYFDVAWRSQSGGGPIFINLIHDINTVIHLLGDIASVQASASNAIRGGQVEDTAVILLKFCNGILGSLSVSDAAAAPWSWELTSAENPAYPATSQACYLIGGTKASLSLPDLTIWRHRDQPDWMTPIESQKLVVDAVDPLTAQIEQFAFVIRDGDMPLVSGEDGLKTLRVVDAIKTAIDTGKTVLVPQDVT